MTLMSEMSPSGVIEWAGEVLTMSGVSDKEWKQLFDAAVTCVAVGGWRLEVCDVWRSMGYGADKIEGAYQ